MTTATTSPAPSTVPIGATPWPNGTVGRYGLRIDPKLLSKLPAMVGGNALVQSADAELQDLDNPDLPTSFDGIAEAGRGGDRPAGSLLTTAC